MSLTSFLTTLFEDGAARASEWAPVSETDRAEALQRLTEFEGTWRESLAGNPPPFDPARALAAAETMFRACQCLVYRELDPQELLSAALIPEPAPRSPSDHYSADLAFRFLPDVWRLGRDIAANDPLVSCVQELAVRWPLSSVGIAGLPAVQIGGFVDDRSLLTLYIDRIVERSDRSRLDNSRVRNALREACGLYSELVPELAEALDGDPRHTESSA